MHQPQPFALSKTRSFEWKKIL